MKIKATEIKDVVLFVGADVEIAGIQSFSFLKVMRLMYESRNVRENQLYTLEALEIMLELDKTDVDELKNLSVDEAAVFDNCGVIKVSQNLYITELIQIKYDHTLLEEGITDEEYVERFLAEQDRFNERIYGCNTSNN